MSKIPLAHIKATSGFEYQASHAVNGNLEYGLNLKSTAPLTVSAPSVANTEFTVAHNLGFVPNGYHILSKDQACDVIASRKGSWTTSQIYLKCTTSSVGLTLVVI